MLDFLLQPENLVFGVALALMLGIAILEGVMTVLGAGLSGLLDNLLPEGVQADLDLDIDGDIDGAEVLDAASPSALSKLLGWLCVGRVPVLVLLVAFLLSFGLVGFALQKVVFAVSGALLPGWIVWLPALAAALPPTRWIGRAVARIVPSDETSAVSVDSFVGRTAVVTLGTAKQGQPAQARLKDQHGQSHYVMVEPDNTQDEFTTGSRVLLVRRVNSTFLAIENTNAALAD